jgi:hypothetical protein
MSRLKGGCTVESPAQPVENTSPLLRRVFIPFGGPQAHSDSQDWLPHKDLVAQYCSFSFSASGLDSSRSAFTIV